ncbi:MAG: DUF59 domain-containing protein [Deltaproteobacteria bacterium]|nr:DUF59 domain-containing protein [Deltaproteobacteria bacterium]
MSEQTDLTEQNQVMYDEAVKALMKVYDPEIPVNVWLLGLIYEVQPSVERKHIDVVMTLTSPACPVAGSIVVEIEYRLLAIEGVETVNVELTWDPPWSPEMMSEDARLELGYL